MCCGEKCGFCDGLHFQAISAIFMVLLFCCDQSSFTLLSLCVFWMPCQYIFLIGTLGVRQWRKQDEKLHVVENHWTGLKEGFCLIWYLIFIILNYRYKRIYKLRWGNGQLCPTPGSAHGVRVTVGAATQIGVHLRFAEWSIVFFLRFFMCGRLGA
jgi:hypothetical protein